MSWAKFPGKGAFGAPAFLVLAIGLVLTVLSAFFVWQYYSAEVKRLLDSEVTHAESAIRQRLAAALGNLRGVQAFFSASVKVEPAEFQAYVRTLRLPPPEGVAYLPRISGPGWETAQARLAAQAPGAVLRPRRDVAEYFPILMLAPGEATQPAVGYDAFSDPARAVAMQAARDTGEPVMTRLMAERGEWPRQGPGWTLYLPLYDPLPPAPTVAQRRAALRGFVALPLDALQFFSGALPHVPEAMRVEIYEQHSPAEQTLVYAAGGEKAVAAFSTPALRRSGLVSYGQTWLIQYRVGLQYALIPVVAPVLTMLAGLLVSSLLFYVTWTQGRARRTAETLLDELRRSEEALRDASRQTTDVLESISEAFLATDEAGRITYANPQACALLRARREQLLGADIRDVIGLAADAEPTVRLDRAVAEKIPDYFETFSRKLAVWLEVNVFPSRGGVAVYMRDISQRRAGEQKLETSEQRFRSLFQFNPQAVVIIDFQWRIAEANPATERITGYSREALRGMELLQLVKESSLPETVEKMSDAAKGVPVNFQMQIRRRDGRFIDLNVVSGPIVVGGVITGVFGFAEDITEELRSKQLLAESEQRYRFVVEGSNDGIWDWDPATGHMYFSDRLLEIVGLDRGALAGQREPLFALVHPDDRAAVQAARKRHFVSGTEFQVEARLRHSDGTYRHCIIRGQAQRNEEGEPVRMAGLISDVTERRQSEEAARFMAEASAKLSASLEHRETMRAVVEAAVPYLADGATLCLWSGDREELHYESTHALVHKQRAMQALSAEMCDQLLANERLASLEPFVMTDKPGVIWERLGLRQASLTRIGIRAMIGIPLRYRRETLGVLFLFASEGVRTFGAVELGLAQELTRRASAALENAVLYERAQQAIRARDEFLSIGSHELKTPITSIQLQVQLLMAALRHETSSATSPDRLLQSLEATDKQVGRLVRLINELLDISRLTTGNLRLEKEAVDLRELAEEVVARFRVNQGKVPIQLTAPEAVAGRWDRMRLDQVLTNLLSNALKYGEGKPVSVAVTAEDGKARISVSDAGIGISARDVERIFGRFERAVTSRNYVGLGMGLFIARQIVEAHGGDIHVISQPGKGSTFIVDLPIEG